MIRKQLQVFLIFVLTLNLTNAGYISYKKPPKYWYYKRQPPLFVYTKPKYHHHHYHHRPNLGDQEIQLYRLAALYKNPLKYTKLPHIGPLDKFKPDKNPIQNGHGWPQVDHKFTKPVFGFGLYDHHQQTPPRHQQEGDDIKPVTEHIENDLKYDFRTKTHSYR